MDNYVLQDNEVILFKEENATCSLIPKGRTAVILTNLYLVYIFKTKIGFRKYETNIEKTPMDSLKLYNDKPQVKQHIDEVELYFVDSVHKITFESFFTAKKFVKQVNELVSGKNSVRRGADKVKSGIGLVDETLGLNTVDTVKGVLQNGVVGTVLGGIGQKRSKSKKTQIAEDVIGIIANNQTDYSDKTGNDTPEQDKPSLTFDEQIQAVTKLKELLDQGILTQEEFDTKKKEIMGL